MNRPPCFDLTNLFAAATDEALTVGTTVAATAAIGAGADGTVTVTVDTAGAGGNAYTVEVVEGVGNNQPLAAAINGTAITVTLATDAGGLPDDAANTATLIAAAVHALTGVSAAASGTGNDPISAAEGPTSFTGGVSSYSLTAAFTCTHVLLTNGAQPVRATFDGSGTPTASEGHYLPAGWSAVVSLAMATAARFIRQGGTNSAIHATPLVR
jgi:hypothetical protein